MMYVDKFERICKTLSEKNSEVNYLTTLSGMFDRIQENDINELIAEFHNTAGRIPYVDDESVDFGALLLQVTAQKLKNNNLKIRLLREAKYRASWYAKGATSGGEGESRKRHLFEIEDQIKKMCA